MAMGTVEGLLEAAMPGQRTFVLSRAGSAGIQRYAANWLGDNCSRWEHLWMSIPMAMGFGVSGQPFIGADVGGFIENTNAGTARALVSIRRADAVLPQPQLHRPERTSIPGSFGDAAKLLCRRALELRYRLLPYIYAAFLRSAETGEPVQKPLIFDYQHDRATGDLDDEYLFGDALLVAPVYTEGCTARQVYLPPGTWHHWHTGEKFAGSRFVIADTPMDFIPIYARGGAVIPMWPEAPASTMDHHPASLELHVFLPDEDGETQSMLHEDDGETFAFRDGAFYRTAFTLRRAGSRVTLDAAVNGHGYPDFQRKELVLHFHGLPDDAVTIQGTQHDLRDGVTALENTGAGFSLQMELPSAIA